MILSILAVFGKLFCGFLSFELLNVLRSKCVNEQVEIFLIKSRLFIELDDSVHGRIGVGEKEMFSSLTCSKTTKRSKEYARFCNTCIPDQRVKTFIEQFCVGGFCVGVFERDKKHKESRNCLAKT